MSATLASLPLASIDANPDNPRLHVGDVDELSESIRSLGILEPLIVAPGKPGRYVLIAGHRRRAAAEAAELLEVPCLVREDLDTKPKQLEAMLVENVQRADLTPIEEGRAYQALLEFPEYTQQKIAKATGRNAKTVRGRIALTQLPDATAEKVSTGEITLRDAETLLEFVDDPDAYARLSSAIGTYNFGWTVQDERSRIKRREEGRARVAELREQSVEVVALPDERGDAEPVHRMRTKTWTVLFADDEAHRAACEHHVYWIQDESPVGWCLQPLSHPEIAEARAAHEDDDEDAAERPAPPDQGKLDTALEARRAWIREYLLGADVKPSDGVIVMLLRRVLAELVDLGCADNADGLAFPPTTDEDEAERNAQAIADLEQTGSLARLVQVIAAIDAGLDGPSGGAWAWKNPRERAKFLWLCDQGYRPSDIEREAYEFYAPAPEPADEAADGDDAADGS